MNPILKVYSFPRSGTNFLLFSIYENFYKDNKQVLFRYNERFKNDLKNYRSLDEENSLINNPMFLFGNHDRFNNLVNLQNSIYIIRNPYDCLYSLYLLEKSNLSWYKNKEKSISYYRWLNNGDRILEWKNHCNSFT